MRPHIQNNDKNNDNNVNGWILYGSADWQADTQEEWTRIAQLGFAMHDGATVTVTELESCLWALAYFHAWLRGPVEALRNVHDWRPLDTKRFKLLELSGLISWSCTLVKRQAPWCLRLILRVSVAISDMNSTGLKCKYKWQFLFGINSRNLYIDPLVPPTTVFEFFGKCWWPFSIFFWLSGYISTSEC